MQEEKVHVRLLIVAGVALLWMAAVFGRLGYLQLVRHSTYVARAQRQQQRTIEITPKRGAICDRHMHPLAMSGPVQSAFAVPSEIGDNRAMAARLLSGVLGILRDVLDARFEAGGSFVWILRKLPPDKAEAVRALNLKCVYLQAENQRYYPKRELASHVLGFVDLDEKGLGGIEYGLDSAIRGKSEKIVVMEDARQRSFDGGVAQKDQGANVVLTIDEKVQYIAERELAAAIAKTHALAGTVIVQNPNNGAILALANWPKFNPNSPNDVKNEARMDRAVSAIYEPGSTFKLITLAAAFDQNLIRPEEVFNCENGAVYVAGHRIRDHKPFGLLTVSDILAQSSDVGAIKIAIRVGAPKFYEYIRAFGFGQQTGVDLPGESRGMLRRLENWTPVSIGSISMGQEVGVTPLQLVTAMTAMANGGLIVRPHVVRALRHGTQVVESAQPEPRRVIRETTAATMRRMLEGVVLNGTGKKARLDGYTSAGKTGTAQKFDVTTGHYSPHQLIASYVGFAPINTPAVTILVQLDSPVGMHEGGQVAAPTFKRVAQQVLAYLDVPHDLAVPNSVLLANRQRNDDRDLADVTDFNPIQVDTAAVVMDDVPGVLEQARGSTAPTVELAEGEGIPVPQLQGRTVREVTEQCMKLGLSPVLVGTGIAIEQSPEPGALTRRGSRITVRFARDVSVVSAAARRGAR